MAGGVGVSVSQMMLTSYTLYSGMYLCKLIFLIIRLDYLCI